MAKTIASPRLATVVGRQAVFPVSTTRAELLPRMADGKIVTAVNLEIYIPPTKEAQDADRAALGAVRSSLSTVVTCNPGETVLLGGVKSTNKNEETETLTFLKADILRPDEKHAKKPAMPVDAELRARVLPVVVGSRPLGSLRADFQVA